jgi:hypothetical protein
MEEAMSDDDARSFLRSESASRLGVSEQPAAIDRLIAVAERWKMPLHRQDGEPARAMAERLSLAIEHKIALMLLDLEEIATLDLAEENP